MNEDLKKVKRILKDNSNEIAFLVGNGINLFGESNGLSWENLLKKLWKDTLNEDVKKIPRRGISYTEIFDILEIINGKDGKGGGNSENMLQNRVVESLKEWEPKGHHKKFINFAKNNNIPVLTTNFDETLKRAIEDGDIKIFRTQKKGFTDYYPWDSYYGAKKFDNPLNGFGIWHINGMIKYKRSIRMGLNHYIGAIRHAQKLINGDNEENRLFSGDSKKNVWKGSKTWLQIIFYKHIFIFGLGLDEREIFLRWLLITRAKYFKKFPQMKRKGWYCYAKEDKEIMNDGKKFFLKKVGIEPVCVEKYCDIYEKLWE